MSTVEAVERAACEACVIPRGTLHLSWANAASGNGSTAMEWDDELGCWLSGCVDQMRFRLACRPGGPVLDVVSFREASQVSATLAPARFTPRPLLARYAPTPDLARLGFAAFTVTL